MSTLSDLIDEAAKRYGLSHRSDYLRRTAQIESGGDPQAFNRGSRASGLFQFIPPTWNSYARGKDPFDPAANVDAAARLTRDNEAALRDALGRDPTDAELYLAHNQGAGGAARMLTDTSQRAGDTVGDSAVASNFKGDPNMTNAAYAARVMAAFNGTKPDATAGTPTGTDTQAALPDLSAAAADAQQKQADANAKLSKLLSAPKVDATKLSSGGAILSGLSDALDKKGGLKGVLGGLNTATPGPGNEGAGGTAETGAQTDAAMGNAQQGDWTIPASPPKQDPISLIASKLSTLLGA